MLRDQAGHDDAEGLAVRSGHQHACPTGVADVPFATDVRVAIIAATNCSRTAESRQVARLRQAAARRRASSVKAQAKPAESAESVSSGSVNTIGQPSDRACLSTFAP